MAISTMAVWRVRIGGNDLNGGAFDSSIVGAGTDYSDQDSAQLSISDLATASASAAVSSASGGFTAAMVGNAIRIASGTNFTAGTYFITAVTDSNNATLDRTCCTAAASAGVAKVGGAFATLNGGASFAIAGNVVLVMGQGSNTPSDIDYITSGALGYVNGVSFAGYNGRPKVGHIGRLFWNNGGYYIRNFYFIQTAGTYTAEGVVNASVGTVIDDCVVDSGGFDATQITNCCAINCAFINTGTQVAGTKSCIVNALGSTVYNCLIKDQRSHGIQMVIGYANLIGCIIQNCGGDGVYSPTNQAFAGRHSHVINNTIHACGGHGISTQNALVHIQDNLITNIAGEGKFGIYVMSGVKTSAQDWGKVFRNNFFNCANNSNVGLSLLDTTIDPQYANAPVDLTPTNTALRYIAGIGVS